jgi:sec-independent protein translocase protein TatB
MFGMGFTEIILIALIAIIALGPEKLPSAMVEVAKFFKSFKNGVTEAKSAIDKEVNLAELKENAQEYKNSLEHTKETIIKESGIEAANEEMQKLSEQLNTNTNSRVENTTYAEDTKENKSKVT